MKITLYKNCILTKSYSEVFDVVPRTVQGSVTTTLELYLATLQKKVIILDTVYATNTGTINFDLVAPYEYDDFYSFNYLKIEDYNGKFIRYCFIDDIRVLNGVASVMYSEDIWHSYAGKMHIRNSYLTRSRKLEYDDNEITFYGLPMQYDGNNAPIIKSLLPMNTQHKVYIVCQLQPYTLASGDDLSKRNTFTTIIGEKDSTGNRYQVKAYSITEALTTLRELQTLSASKSMIGIFGTEVTPCYFEFSNVTLMPIEYLTNVPTLFAPDIGTAGNLYGFYNLASHYSSNFVNLWSGIINTTPQGIVDFRVISVGTYTNQIEITNNGTSIESELSMYVTDFDFKLLLKIQNKVIDITNEFVVDIPFNSVTGDITAQREIARQAKVFNGAMSITNGVINIGESTADMITGVSAGKVSQLTKSGKIANNFVAKTRRANIIENEISGGVSGIVGGISQVANGIFDIVQANKPQYTTSKGTFVSSNGSLNAYYGLCVIEIDADNIDNVFDVIDNTGYMTYQFVNDEVLTTAFTDYNVISFDFINIYGEFTQNICEQLKFILLSGLKIWYDYQLGE